MNVQRFKETRIEKKLTQKEVASYLQTTQQHYSSYESGKVEMPLFQFRNLCILFDVSADYLLGLSDCKDIRKKRNRCLLTAVVFICGALSSSLRRFYPLMLSLHREKY